MTRDIYIGIDPGAKGFMCLQGDIFGGIKYIPLMRDKEFNPEIRETLESIILEYSIVACIEQVGAMPGQGLSSTFKFGERYGYIQGLLSAYQIPIVRVRPQKWQREMWDPSDRVKGEGGKINAKQTSYLAARRLHPALSFRRTDKCKNYDDNMVDATLICDYAIRKNL